MKNFVMKVASVVLVGAMGLAFAGCSKGEAKSSESSGSEKFTVEEGKLVMATNAFFPPYEYYEGDKIVGIDAEIAAAVADKLGLTLEIQDPSMSRNGKYSVTCEGFNKSGQKCLTSALHVSYGFEGGMHSNDTSFRDASVQTHLHRRLSRRP